MTSTEGASDLDQPMEEFVLPDEDKIVGAVRQVLGPAPAPAAVS